MTHENGVFRRLQMFFVFSNCAAQHRPEVIRFSMGLKQEHEKKIRLFCEIITVAKPFRRHLKFWSFRTVAPGNKKTRRT